MPPAARVTDLHVCPMVTGIVPHVGGPILPPGVPTVLIDFLPAATITSMATCVGPPDIIVLGSLGVMIGGLPAARMGDITAHGGVIVLGSFTCIIGEIGAPSPGASGLGGVVAGMVASGVATTPVASGDASKYSTPVVAAGTSPAAGAEDTPLTRMATAKEFYSQTGWPEKRIAQHLRGIDFSKPVEVVTLQPEDVVKQWVDPNQNVGGYFDADALPEELGICPANVVPRELRTFVISKPVKVLKSTAAAIKIDWLPTPPIQVPGGATQLFMLPNDKTCLVPGVPGK
jgi:uncharacterized Zn-binding protein involved in type VI secretion